MGLPILVQKFGGTSVDTQDHRAAAAQHVKEARANGYDVVVVISAMGRKGSPYATDTLINMVKHEGGPVSEHDMELALICGELLSSVVFAASLRDQGVEPVSVLTGWQAGIVTDNHFGNARILRVDPGVINERLTRGEVVVVAGFQGAAENGDITTLGRGGSDTTAAALGVGLSAELVEIYTDVKGIMTADPKLVGTARVLDEMGYDEVFQFASEGAGVIHPRAVEIAQQGRVPLVIRETRSQDPGTKITDVRRRAFETRTPRPVTGVTHLGHMTQLTVLTPGAGLDVERAIFDSLAASGVSVDMINVGPDSKHMIVHDEQAATAVRALEPLGVKTELRPRVAKVSIVGAGMHGIPGVMARVVRSLAEVSVRVLQSSDSNLSISCLVDESEVGAAVQALHRAFSLEAE